MRIFNKDEYRVNKSRLHKEIIEGAEISRASLFNYWEQLESQEIVCVTRRFGKTKLYTLNSKSQIVKKVLELESVLISRALEKRNPSKQRLVEVNL